MILIIVIVMAFIAPIDYAPVYLLNPEKALSYNNTFIVDSIKCAHIEVLNDLESKGVLLIYFSHSRILQHSNIIPLGVVCHFYFWYNILDKDCIKKRN